MDIQQTLFAINEYFSSANADRQHFYKNFILLSFIQLGENHIENQIESANYQDFIQQIASIIPLEGDDTQPILNAIQTSITKLAH